MTSLGSAVASGILIGMIYHATLIYRLLRKSPASPRNSSVSTDFSTNLQSIRDSIVDKFSIKCIFFKAPVTLDALVQLLVIMLQPVGSRAPLSQTRWQLFDSFRPSSANTFVITRHSIPDAAGGIVRLFIYPFFSSRTKSPLISCRNSRLYPSFHDDAAETTRKEVARI